MRIPFHWIHPPLTANCGALIAATFAAFLLPMSASRAGPCTAQIAQLQLEVSLAAANPVTGPSATQTVGAQLHHQPTPTAVQHAQTVANTDADVAVDRARKADAEGNAVACDEALREARQLYGID